VDIFFRAEDGIRDFHVTGVQTCALPVWKAVVEDRHAGTSRLGREDYAGAGPVEAPTCKCGSRTTRRGVPPFCSDSIRSCTATRLISRMGCTTVVSGGLAILAKGAPSK